jgi:DNA-binding FadR family transcriptional regulator
MPIRAVRKVRLSRRIAEHLSTLIESGQFEPGHPLPPERDLARQLGVSRPSVREALISLEIEGKVEARVGLGVFVLDPRSKLPAVRFGERRPLEILRARRVVEGELAATAARARSALDRVALGHALDAVLTALPDPSFHPQIDRKFHVAVASAAHNDAMLEIARELCEPGGRSGSPDVDWTPSLRAATMLDYRAIVDSIEARDRRGARAAMHRHLDRRILIATFGPVATYGAKRSLEANVYAAAL